MPKPASQGLRQSKWNLPRGGTAVSKQLDRPRGTEIARKMLGAPAAIRKRRRQECVVS